ncbi:MAG: hypothetical protein IJ246_11615 [Clostridia bacterium]|nr:hypothetical protein [Clostridia bacterium]
MHHYPLLPLSQIHTVCCATASPGGWQVSSFTMHAPMAEWKVRSAIRHPNVRAWEKDPEHTLLLQVLSEEEDDTAYNGPSGVIRCRENLALQSYAAQFPVKDQGPVLILFFDEFGLLIRDTEGTVWKRYALPLSAVDFLIIAANRHPEDWGGSAEPLTDPEPDMEGCALLRRYYFEKEREGLTDETITCFEAAPVYVCLDMMTAILEAPSPWRFSAHLSSGMLCGMGEAYRDMNWPEAVSTCLRDAYEAVREKAGENGTIIFAGDAGSMEQMKALAAEAFPGFHLLSDPGCQAPVHEGIHRMAEDLIQQRYEEEIAQYLQDFLRQPSAVTRLTPFLTRIAEKLADEDIRVLQMIWESTLNQWAAGTLEPGAFALHAGMELRGQFLAVRPHALAALKPAVEEALRNVCDESVRETGQRLGVRLRDNETVFLRIRKAISETALHTRALRQMMDHMERFLYRRLALYLNPAREMPNFFFSMKRKRYLYENLIGKDTMYRMHASDMQAFRGEAVLPTMAARIAQQLCPELAECLSERGETT